MYFLFETSLKRFYRLKRIFSKIFVFLQPRFPVILAHSWCTFILFN